MEFMITQFHYLVVLDGHEQFSGPDHWNRDKLWEHLRRVGRPMVKRLLDSGLPCQSTTDLYDRPPTVTHLHFGPELVGKQAYLDELIQTMQVIGPDDPAQ
jgi:hypothetical protein